MAFDKVTHIMLDVRRGCTFSSFPNFTDLLRLIPWTSETWKRTDHVEQVAWRGALPIDRGVSQPEVTL